MCNLIKTPYNDNSIEPYDNRYPIATFSQKLNEKMEKANNTIQNICDYVVRESAVTNGLANDNNYKLVVDVSDKVLKDIQSNKIKLAYDKEGNCFAQLMDGNNFGKKLPVKMENVGRVVDPMQMAMAMQMMKIQEQLEDISEQIDNINANVLAVLQGQQNDRIGLYYSGVDLYLEADSIQEKTFKNMVYAQSLKALSDATHQIRLAMNEDIKYLQNKEYDKIKGHRKDMIKSRMDNINRCFGFIHQSAMLKAAIYCDMNELKSMAIVLNEYSSFIENEIANRADFLAQYDINDNAREDGIWKSRARLRLDVSDFSNRLDSSDNVLYLDVERNA